MEDTELVEGLVLDQKASHYAGGLTRVEKAKIGLIQFCISPPKTDVSACAGDQSIPAHSLDHLWPVCVWMWCKLVKDSYS